MKQPIHHALGLALVLAFSWGTPARPLDYVESSLGLGTPALEGGRTEAEMADVNGDGHIDLVSIGDHGSPYINTNEHGVMVWFGDGTGSWSVFQFGDFGYGGVAVGDVNNDGLMDVAYGMHHDYSSTDLGDQILEAALGDGTGTFWTAWDDGLATNGETWGMFGTDLADLDNDGDLDIGSVSFGCCAGVHVYLNQGDGTWIQSFGFLGGNSGMEFTFGDVNGDGNADFVAGHQSGTAYFGDGDGDFTLSDTGLPPAGSLGRRGPDLGDANGDGRDDLSLATSNGGVQVWTWDMLGSWANASKGLPAGGPYSATQLHDMDGDGLADLCAFGSGTVTVWLSDGMGNWTQAASFNVGSPGKYQALRVGGDADHNGHPDIVLVDEEGSYPNYQNHLRFFKETSVPAQLTARLEHPHGGEVWIVNSIRFIRWASGVPSVDPGAVRLELSTSGSEGPWSPIADELPNNGLHQWLVAAASPSDDCYIRARVTAGGDTAWAVSPNAFTITPEDGSSVPEIVNVNPGLRILSIWPNPARDDVYVRYQGPAGERLQLEIFDLLGRRVRRLQLPVAGHAACTFQWRARDAGGIPMPGGVYFLNLRSSREQATRQLRLAR